MKKEIGSLFPLSDKTIRRAEFEQSQFLGDRVYYSLCREALFDIAQTLGASKGKVLLPAYTCQTVITPFAEAGWQCEFFPVKKDLRIDILGLANAVARHQPALLVVHPYFGMDLNDEEESLLTEIKKKGVEIVLDLTQCLFSQKHYAFSSFVVGSYRKWMPLPDGGFLLNNTDLVQIVQPETENVEFTEREIAAMYLRGQYFANGEQRTKEISIRLSKAADHIADKHIFPHKMSKVAYTLLQKEDLSMIKNSRLDNYAYLFKNVRESERIAKVCQCISEVTTAPLYFTIFVENRPELQRLLAQNSVYAPIIWPVEDERVLINDEVRYIYEHILAIPCDQRYDENDMRRVVEIINTY